MDGPLKLLNKISLFLQDNCDLDEEVLERSKNPWKLENFHRIYVAQRFHYLPSKEIHDICEKYLDEYEEDLKLNLSLLRNGHLLHTIVHRYRYSLICQGTSTRR